MRAVLLCLVATGCGSVSVKQPDARTDSPIDAAIDARPVDAACLPTVLLTGGTDVGPQGWSVVMQAPATVTNGPDYVKLQTSTVPGAATSGQLVLNYPGAIETGKAFALEVVMLVEAVNTHNQFDSGAAILGSYTPPFGAGNDRSEMIYLDAGAIGWADDTQTHAVAIANNAYHTYVLAVTAAGVATVTVDGANALTRTGYTTNGAIAIGDQTNDVNVDSTLRIKSVRKLCP